MRVPAAAIMVCLIAGLGDTAAAQDTKLGFGHREYVAREFEFSPAQPFSSMARRLSKDAATVLTFIDSDLLKASSLSAKDVALSLNQGLNAAARFSNRQRTNHWIFYVRSPDGKPIWKDAFDYALMESTAAKSSGFSPARPPSVFSQMWYAGALREEMLLGAGERSLSSRADVQSLALTFIGRSIGAEILPVPTVKDRAVSQYINRDFETDFPKAMPLDLVGRYYSVGTVAIVTVTADDSPCHKLQRHQVQYALKQMKAPDTPLAIPVRNIDIRLMTDSLNERASAFSRQELSHVKERWKDKPIPVTGIYANGRRIAVYSMRQDPPMKFQDWVHALRVQIVNELEKLRFLSRGDEPTATTESLFMLIDLQIEALRISAECLTDDPVLAGFKHLDTDDTRRAVQAFTQAGEKGFPEGYYLASTVHRNLKHAEASQKKYGYHVLNKNEALRLLKLSAQNGYPKAQHELAWRLVSGSTVTEPMRVESRRWTRAAAEQGYLPAIESLAGDILVRAVDRRGTDDEKVEAYKWTLIAYSYAKKAKDATAIERISRDRKRLEGVMSSQQINLALATVGTWKPKAWADLKSKN